MVVMIVLMKEPVAALCIQFNTWIFCIRLSYLNKIKFNPISSSWLHSKSCFLVLRWPFRCYRSAGPVAFDTDYIRWLEEHDKHINELRNAVKSHARDPELRRIADNVTAHYDEVFRMKGNAAKADVVHVLSGMWKTPAERFCMWIGGFRPSLLLKVTSSYSHFRQFCTRSSIFPF